MRKYLYISVLLSLLNHINHAQEMNVLTYNIRYDNPKDSLNNWDNRKDFLISQLHFFAPDVFGVQEGLVHQLEDIQKGLDGYVYIGKGRDDGKSSGEFSAIFYNINKLEPLEHNTFWLSKTPNTPSKGWDAAIKRVCTYALFKFKESDNKFWVFNTHFDHVGEQARKESIKLILDKIKNLNLIDYPVILMGDFNLEPHHPSIRSLSGTMNDTRLVAGRDAFGPKGTFNGFRFFEPVTRRIDYIFISKNNLDILKYGVLSDSRDCRYPSDHLPVFTRLRINK